MIVRELIKTLVNFPMDAQVVNENKSPIMFAGYCGRETDMIKLKTKEDINLNGWLDDFFGCCLDGATSDYDACMELDDLGVTLEDLRNYREDTYRWALNSGYGWKKGDS